MLPVYVFCSHIYIVVFEVSRRTEEKEERYKWQVKARQRVVTVTPKRLAKALVTYFEKFRIVVDTCISIGQAALVKGCVVLHLVTKRGLCRNL